MFNQMDKEMKLGLVEPLRVPEGRSSKEVEDCILQVFLQIWLTHQRTLNKNGNPQNMSAYAL
jgi:hypothetical protein